MSSELSLDTINRSAFSIGALHKESDELAYWLARTPQERIHHIQRLRRINYGHRASERLQRVLEVVELTSG